MEGCMGAMILGQDLHDYACLKINVKRFVLVWCADVWCVGRRANLAWYCYTKTFKQADHSSSAAISNAVLTRQSADQDYKMTRQREWRGQGQGRGYYSRPSKRRSRLQDDTSTWVARARARARLLLPPVKAQIKITRWHINASGEGEATTPAVFEEPTFVTSQERLHWRSITQVCRRQCVAFLMYICSMRAPPFALRDTTSQEAYLDVMMEDVKNVYMLQLPEWTFLMITCNLILRKDLI